MDERAKRLLWVGAFATGVTAAFLMSALVERQLAEAVGFAAGWIYAAFAFQPTKKRAIAMSVTAVVWIFGASYFFNVRTDVIGFVVMVVCGAICFAIYWPFRHELRQGR
jgi:hypothetical protein